MTPPLRLEFPRAIFHGTSRLLFCCAENGLR